MNTKKIIGIALLAVGAILLYMGVEASESFTSFWSKWWEGVPSDKSMRLMISGGVSLVIGAFVLWQSRGNK